MSDARKTTVSATSSGLATRPSGIEALSALSLSGSVVVDVLIGVSTAPGATLSTLMPWGPSSTAALRVSIRIPPFDTQYGVLPGIGQSSWTEEMLMMTPPPPWAMNCLAASCDPKNALFRLTAITLS